MNWAMNATATSYRTYFPVYMISIRLEGPCKNRYRNAGWEMGLGLEYSHSWLATAIPNQINHTK